MMWPFQKKTKTFRSDAAWFEIQIPTEWVRYDDLEGTYAFFNPKAWKGNFRITPFQLNKEANDSAIENIGKENNTRKLQIGNYNCLYYESEIRSEDEHSIMYNWLFYISNYVFLCSYTTNYEYNGIKQTEAEISKTENTIKSLKLL